MLKIDLKYDKSILFITLEGILNRSTSYKINNYLIPSILRHNIKYGVLKLQSLQRIDDDGIDSLLNVKTAFKNNKGLLFLQDYNSNIMKQIRQLHLKKSKSLNMIGA